MITCDMEYRHYVPSGWIAIEFFRLHFHGENKRELESGWHHIEFDKYDEIESKIDKIKDTIKELESDRQELNDEKKAFNRKSWWKFWERTEINILRDEIYNIDKKINELEIEKDELEEDQFYNTYELEQKAKKYLLENGFEFQSICEEGGECGTVHEVWVKK